MSLKVPKLSISQGQLLWSLSCGQEPPPGLVDEVRYFRALGIPFEEKSQAKGRGNRLTYGFDEIAELAIAFALLRRGVKKKDIAQQLTKDRGQLKRHLRHVFESQPEGALTSAWVKSRGTLKPILGDEVFWPVYDRNSETPGKIEFLKGRGLQSMRQGSVPVMHMANGEARELLPVTRILLEVIAWALEAPVTKHGPSPKAK